MAVTRQPQRFKFSRSIVDKQELSNNHHFFKGSADDLSPLTLSYCHKRTNACVKNLRHGFLVECVKKFIVLLCSFLMGLELNLHRHNYAFTKNVSNTLPLVILRFSKERAIICD